MTLLDKPMQGEAFGPMRSPKAVTHGAVRTTPPLRQERDKLQVEHHVTMPVHLVGHGRV
jgi:hypothetical protein